MHTRDTMSSLGPLRTVVLVSNQRYGRHGGTIKLFKLDCGHTVTHLFRPDLTVGSRTGCSKCR